MKRSFIREILEAIDEQTISFAGGLPDESLFPIADLRTATKKSLKKSEIWQYSKTNGLESLREKIALGYTKEGFETKAENILITTGSQQALFILARYFKDRKIILEQPSYLGAINTFKLNDLKIKSVKLEDDGLDMEEFEKFSKKVKLSYLIPDFQNPSTATYSSEKREAVAKIIRKNKGYLIEDSPYSDLYFEKKFKTVSSHIPDRSFLLGSFSKTLAPSLRIGWIRADKKLIEKLLPIKESIDLHSCGLSQGILDEYLKETKSFEKHLKILQNNYRQKMEYFCDCLDKKLPQFKYTKPKGGMFIYGKLDGVDIYDLLNKCQQRKVVFVPADEFYVGKKGSCAIRFNFTNTTFKEMEKGIDIIADILKSY